MFDGELLRGGFGIRRLHVTEVDDRERVVDLDEHALAGQSVFIEERRTQCLMAADDFIEAPFQGGDVQPAVELQVKTVVVKFRRTELVQNPEALLGKERGHSD